MSGTTSRLKREGPGERINVYVPPELAQTVRETSAKERRSVSDSLTEALKEWVERKRGTVEEPPKRIVIDVPARLHRALKQLALDRGVTMASIILELLSAHEGIGE